MTTCRRCRGPIEEGDLRCAVCAMATGFQRAAVQQAIARILRCDGCGAALAFSAEVGAPRCAFCAAVMHVEQPTDPVEVAERALPFAVSPEQARASLGVWLSSLGFFRPGDLASGSSVENLRALAWCGWLVEAEALVSWTADSDAGSRLSSWAPHSGQTQMRFSRMLIPASRGLVLAECQRLVPQYDLRGLVPAANLGGGALVEQFDVQRSAARGIVVDAITRTAADRLQQERHIPGSRFRNVRPAVLLRSLRTERVALPVYVLAYRYKGKSYRAIVHGQDARHTFGDAPYSYAKIALAIVVALLATMVVLNIIALVTGR